jgi:diacylglycerol kinase family enzyme
VIFNPTAGRGRTDRLVRHLRRDLGDRVSWRPSDRPGHAEELARTAANEGARVVVAVGGDGTAHDVANGLLASGRPDVIFSTWPLGSSNDYAYALGLSNWWLSRNRWLQERPIAWADVGRVVAGERSRWFINGLGLGFNGAVTLESRGIRGLQGLPLYAVALLRAAVRHFVTPEIEIAFDGVTRRGPTLATSVSLGPREGGFPLFPTARLDDGRFDTFHCGPISRWELLRHLPAMATGTLPTNHPRFTVGTASRVEVRSRVPLRVHLDGEFFCQPDEEIREFNVELHPQRLAVETFPPGEPRFLAEPISVAR